MVLLLRSPSKSPFKQAVTFSQQDENLDPALLTPTRTPRNFKELMPSYYGTPPSETPLAERMGIPPLPSSGWLHWPAHIDGGVYPARSYTDKSAANTLSYYKHLLPTAASPGMEIEVISHPSLPKEKQASIPVPTKSSLDIASLLTSVALVTTTRKPPTGRAQKATVKREQTVKVENIPIASLDRKGFIYAVLHVHSLDHDYAPGEHNGPSFKLSWTSSVGGKGNAPTIDTEHDWETAKAALLRKKLATVQVYVELDLKVMHANAVKVKRGIGAVDTDKELTFGSKVPRLDAYSAMEQQEGAIALELRKQHKCDIHLGEHGQPGCCFVRPDGEHERMTNRKIKVWGAAIRAHNATKNEPPNSIDFDGVREVRPRGRNGPCTANLANSSPTADLGALLMAATVLLLTNLLSQQTASMSAAALPSTPSQMGDLCALPCTPGTVARIPPATPPSPIPAKGDELKECLFDFFAHKEIDLRGSFSALSALDLMPDILYDVPVERLVEITGGIEGQIHKLRIFSKSWSEHLEEKRGNFKD
ncbi:hypothetical protein DL96DRAFT_1706489 [Flagelloscypha sp. PMI_526]|nr:hypothetical protein DL96DRAFT_1706489 [Flagelloscypha sp. PMI_526]